MLEKTIAIGDKQVKFRSSATIPRLYRVKFKRDIFKDLSRLESSYKGNSDDGSSFEIEGPTDFRECGLYHGLPCRPQHPGHH